MNTASISNCLNCKTNLHGMVFCGNCGQRNVNRRLVWRNLVEDLNVHILEWDQPWLRTIKELAIRPGQVCSDYVDGRRIIYVNPIQYMFYILAIIVLVFGLSKPDGTDIYQLQPFPEFYEYYPPAIRFILSNIPLYLFLMSPVAILIFRVVFWRSNRNWIEITCFVFYMIGNSALILSLLSLTEYSDSDITLLSGIEFVIASVFGFCKMFGIPLYIAYAAIHFFKSRLHWSFIGALVATYSYIILCLYIRAVFVLLYLDIVNAYTNFP